MRQRLPGAVLLGALLASSAPGPTVASTAPFELPGYTRSAVTVDLDGGDAPAIVRLAAAAADDPLTLERWSLHDGSWRRDAAIPAGAAASHTDAAPALLNWRRDGRASALAIAPTPAGLAISEVVPRASGIRLRPIEVAAATPADTVRALDVDGDGTDELALTTLVGSDPLLDPVRSVAILRLDGDAFTLAWSSPEPITSVVAVPGEADGVPGDELYLGPGPGGELRRVAWRSGALAEETTTLRLGGPRWAEVVGTLNGAVVVRTPGTLVAQRWPMEGADGELARVRMGAQGGVGIVGTGADAVVVTSRGYLTPQGAIGVYDEALTSLGRYGESSAAGLVWDLVLVHAAPLANLERSIFPYIGPIPVALDTPPGFLANGMLATAGPDGHRVRPASPLLGYSPVGLAGPDGGWMVLRGGPGGPTPGTVTLRRLPTDGDGRVVAVPAEIVLDPPGLDASEMLTFDGAVRHATGDARATVRSGPEGFGVDVGAPADSIVAVIGQRFDSRVAGEDPWTLRIEPSPRLVDAAGDPGSGDRPFRRWILVVLPDGSAVAERWDGLFVEEPPELDVVSRRGRLDGEVEIAGRTEAGNEVSVAGEAVVLGPTGAFSTTAPIELLPRVLTVEVADPFGNVTRSTVTLPGVVDPAGLPWVPLVAVATLVAGIVMFLRVPAGRRVPLPAEDGVGRLEEIDGD